MVLALCGLGAIGVVGIALLTAGHAPAADSALSVFPSESGAAIATQPSKTSVGAGLASPSSSGPGPAATPGRSPSGPVDVYAGTGVGMFAPAVAGLPSRVYVPDEQSGTVIVIDPLTFKVVDRFSAGARPEHVTPDWDLRRLYVNNSAANSLTIIDPRTGRPSGIRTVPDPYNLYFSLDGSKAIVVLDSSLSGSEYGASGSVDSGPRQLYFYDRRTWRLLKALRIPWAGADHLDFSADGRFFLMSTEYAGRLVKVDVARMAVAGALFVGGSPVDVRLAPDGQLFYAANQRLGGVSIVDAVHMRKVGFIRTGRGAHGLAISRDDRRLYVTNRQAGTLSVIDFAARTVVATWRIGGTPDMIAVSPDGTQLWISNRYSGTVTVVDTSTGQVVRTIRVGGRPHGLTYYPEPGSLSLGHNGVYR